MTERERALYNKLKALAERGVGGESENAKAFLEEFVKTHPEFQNYTQDEDIDAVECRCFHFNKSDVYARKLMYQLLAKEFGRDEFFNGAYLRHSGTLRRREIKGEVYFDCTAEDWLRISFLYNFYYNRWQEKLKTFYDAFIQKNNLGIETEGDDGFTDEEREKLFRMMEGFDEDTPDAMAGKRLKGNNIPLLNN